MRKFLLIITLLLLEINLSAQVVVSYDNEYEADPNSVLDLSSITDKGFLGPKVKLTSRFDNITINRPNIGLVVYNTETVENFDPLTGENVQSLIPGYYSWNGSKWMSFESKESTKFIKNETFSAATLGYLPLGSYRNAPLNFEKNGVNAKQTKCTYSQGTLVNTKNILYCAYDLTSNATGEAIGVSWNDAFNLAKEIGGHLPVITSALEIETIKLNFFHKDISSRSRYQNSWIGLRSIAAPGEKPKFHWITGEKTQHDWTGGRYIFNFDNNLPTTEGCGFYSFDNINSNLDIGIEGNIVDRKWNVSSCETTQTLDPHTGKNFLMSYLLVEFLYE